MHTISFILNDEEKTFSYRKMLIFKLEKYDRIFSKLTLSLFFEEIYPYLIWATFWINKLIYLQEYTGEQE